MIAYTASQYQKTCHKGSKNRLLIKIVNFLKVCVTTIHRSCFGSSRVFYRGRSARCVQFQNQNLVRFDGQMIFWLLMLQASSFPSGFLLTFLLHSDNISFLKDVLSLPIFQDVF